MNTNTLIDTLVGPLAAGFLTIARLSNPDADNAALTAAAEGDVKHALRAKIGWAVDFLWAAPGFKEQIDALFARLLIAPAAGGPGAGE